MDNSQELLDNAFVDLDQMGCNQIIKCPYKERTLSYAIGVQIPTPGQPPEEQFKECCYNHLTLADVNSSEDFKNDYSAFYHQRQLANETANFFLYQFETDIETPLNNDDFGKFFGFGYFTQNINMKGYLVQWKKVLEEFGEGNFKIIKRITIAGVPLEYSSIVFTLKQFTSSLADKTVRIDIVMNGRLQKTEVDFTGLAWKHSLRLPGFFGRREAQHIEDNLISRTYEKKQISMRQTNEFKFQTNLIPDCLTNEVFDFILFANDIYMNDYNLNNHSYNFVKFGVKFGSNEGTGYGSLTRKAKLNLVFNDKFENNIKRNYS